MQYERNPVAGNAWKYNRASVIEDKRKKDQRRYFRVQDCLEDL